MKVIETAIPGVKLIEPVLFGDARGVFLESWRRERYAEAGLPREFVQDNLSRSIHKVLRGLHLQHPNGQGKLITVLSGRVLDVAVDVRRGSPTFRQHVAIELAEYRQLWVPPGLAHGFYVLSATADVAYKCDAPYRPQHEIAIRWNDPSLGIAWPDPEPLLSPRDAAAPLLDEIADLPVYGFRN
jgi:dTDP-4-dehydrorhamnose 3,5-epimerase